MLDWIFLVSGFLCVISRMGLSSIIERFARVRFFVIKMNVLWLNKLMIPEASPAWSIYY